MNNIIIIIYYSGTTSAAHLGNFLRCLVVSVLFFCGVKKKVKKSSIIKAKLTVRLVTFFRLCMFQTSNLKCTSGQLSLKSKFVDIPQANIGYLNDTILKELGGRLDSGDTIRT